MADSIVGTLVDWEVSDWVLEETSQVGWLELTEVTHSVNMPLEDVESLDNYLAEGMLSGKASLAESVNMG